MATSSRIWRMGAPFDARERTLDNEVRAERLTEFGARGSHRGEEARDHRADHREADREHPVAVILRGRRLEGPAPRGAEHAAGHLPGARDRLDGKEGDGDPAFSGRG